FRGRCSKNNTAYVSRTARRRLWWRRLRLFRGLGVPASNARIKIGFRDYIPCSPARRWVRFPTTDRPRLCVLRRSPVIKNRHLLPTISRTPIPEGKGYGIYL